MMARAEIHRASSNTQSPAKNKVTNKALSTSNVARLLNVAPASIANWVDSGQLHAGRTPGGHRRIKTEDLLDFLHRQKLPIPEELNPAPTRILVVDDEESVTKWITAEINERRPEYEVITAQDGFSAGEIVGSLQPDVVILDLWMPDLDGFEVCRRIKSRPGGDNIVVIAITGQYTPQVAQRIEDCGAAMCLEKPFEIEQILSNVEKWVHR